MKNLNKVLVLVLSAIMMLAMSASVFAQDVALDPAHADNATITITNAANGETYTIAKLFDATVNDAATSIAYTGDIPESLAAYFEENAKGNISAKAALDLDDPTVQAALKTWALANPTNSAKSTGGALNFTGLPYGYYVIVTTQGAGLLTVDSTMKNATVKDKNTTPPVVNLSKSADETDVFIGQTVTYTVSFETANYYKASETADPEQIIEYTITDTPAANALNDITVTSIIVDADADTTTTGDQTTVALQQFADNKITIPWVNAAKENLYANGAALIVTYTGVVADTAAIDGNGNKNTVEASFKTDKGTTPPPGTYTDDETIFTYAVAIKKVDQAGNDLAGATFKLPFYVKETAASDGAYVYAGAASGTGLTNSLTTPANGLIIIKGVKSGTYKFEETAAPAGYNKLTDPVSVTAVKTGSTTTSTTTYLDADGNIVDTQSETTSTVEVTISQLSATPVVVVNKTGAELPSTGGIGTTIFYVLGSLLVIGCGIVLVSRRRMQNNK